MKALSAAQVTTQLDLANSDFKLLTLTLAYQATVLKSDKYLALLTEANIKKLDKDTLTFCAYVHSKKEGGIVRSKAKAKKALALLESTSKPTFAEFCSAIADYVKPETVKVTPLTDKEKLAKALYKAVETATELKLDNENRLALAKAVNKLIKDMSKD